MSALDTHLCPVCGYDGLLEPPWSNGAASDEICPSCGTHLGYDDAAGGDAGKRARVHRTLRCRWIEEGMRWRSEGIEKPPPDWDPEAQLRVFDEER